MESKLKIRKYEKILKSSILANQLSFANFSPLGVLDCVAPSLKFMKIIQILNIKSAFREVILEILVEKLMQKEGFEEKSH